MQKYQQLPKDIRQQIANLQSKLLIAKLLKRTAKQEALLMQESYLKRIKSNINAYQYSIELGLFKETLASHKSELKELKEVISRLQITLQTIKNDIDEDSLFQNRTKDKKSIDYNNRQIVIHEGNNAQKQSEQALKRIQKNVIELDIRADDITLEMNRQIKELDKTYDYLNDTQTTLKRAEEHLNYFGKQIYTDKLIICMIIVIALAILVIIGLAIAGKTPKSTNSTVK